MTKKQYVEDLVSTPKHWTCPYLAAPVEEVSHDVGTNFLPDQRFLPREVWKLGKDRIHDRTEARLIVDDRGQDNRSSRVIDLVRAQDSGNEHGGGKGWAW